VPIDEFISKSLIDIKRRYLLRVERIISKVQGPFIFIGRKKLINFSSNDYLGIGQHPKLVGQIKKVLAGWNGWGICSSRLMAGTTIWHKKLEERLARFKKKESSLYFSSGYSANLGLVSALVGEDATLILADELNHASLIDAVKLTKAKIIVYPHKSIDFVHSVLKKESGGFGKILIITDAIFSMEGDIAPLGELHRLGKRYGATLIVDDSHGTGVLGENGRGTCEYLNLEQKIEIVTGGLGKAVGSIGGFVVGTKALTRFLYNKARSFIFTTAHPPAIAAATIMAIDIIESEKWRRLKLQNNRTYLADSLAKIGLKSIKVDFPTPIIPILIGESEKAVKVADFLFQKGIFATAIRYPTVPKSQARLRISLTALHEKEHLDKLVDVISTI